MKRSRLTWLAVGISLVALIGWLSSRTHWEDVKIPALPRGEALVDSFYAAQRFAEALGARTALDRVLVTPPANSVIVLSDWHWSVSTSRREALERWVESGGRLVVDGRLAGGEAAFERWSGIARGTREKRDAQTFPPPKPEEGCGTFREEYDGKPVSGFESTRYTICNVDRDSSLTSWRNAAWALRDGSGIQAIRVNVGRGRVTVINADTLRHRSLFEGDHGWLFVAATELARGDEVHFLSEETRPSLLALVWQYGGPVVVLVLALISLVLWRGGVRFGPLAPAPTLARRSLAEQIRGTGAFALRHGGGDALLGAALRALEEVAARRISGYARLSTNERALALGRLTGFDQGALAAAFYHARSRGSHDLRSAIGLLEGARREALATRTRPSHGIR